MQEGLREKEGPVRQKGEEEVPGQAVGEGEEVNMLKRSTFALLAFVTVAVLALSASPALANAPWFHVASSARPTYLPSRGKGQIVVTVVNLGDATAHGEATPITVADLLPKRLHEESIEGRTGSPDNSEPTGLLRCSFKAVTCTLEGELPPYAKIEMRIGVSVEASAKSGEVNEGTVTGGGVARAVSARQPITVSNAPTPFGIETYEMRPENEGGTLDTQAGSHPFQTTLTVGLNIGREEVDPKTGDYEAEPAALIKNLSTKLPAGFIGNPVPFPRCTLPEFQERTCPSDTVLGVATVQFNEPAHLPAAYITVPVFNLEPQVGEPARFGFLPTKFAPVFIDTSVRAGEDYGITGEVESILETVGFFRSEVTLWGVPGAAGHDGQRGYACLGNDANVGETCTPLDAVHPAPLLSEPTSCPGQPLVSEAEATSWLEPENIKRFRTGEAGSEAMPTLDGCNDLPFKPAMTVVPDSEAASSSSGLSVDVHVNQGGALNPEGLTPSDVQGITVVLPPGVAVNPSGGDGLEACSDALIGYEPEKSTPPSELRFTPFVPGGAVAKRFGDESLFEPGVNFCSNASKIGTAEISTPLLQHPLKGAVYLGAQEANPFGSLLAAYIVAEEPESGVLVKLPGEISLNQQTGQVTTTFRNSPQAPFEDAVLHFYGGERAPLSTPPHCGTYTTTGTFAPWSGNPPSEAQASFQTTSGPNGSPCPGEQLPFNPTATAGATNIQAGEFSPFTFTMSRKDGEQNLQSGEVKLPPGILGVLSNIEQCPEPQANEGTCGPNSLIGETTISVGVGSQPFTVAGGKVYLTGPYNGTSGCTAGTPGCAPFGLSIVNPAKAGPFDLADTKSNHPACDCVLVRAKIEVDPFTAGLTIGSNRPGTPDSIPTMIAGIPLQIQHVNVITTRKDFQFNPTNCSKMEAVAHLFSAEGGTDTITAPFQVTNCAALKFEPKFGVSVSGKTSKADGASLSVKLTYPNVPRGTDANVGYVKVELPEQLPSRLTTLQKACASAQFNANPAGCPAASVVGRAKAITPLIPVPLEGPAYFVSHGGEAFPALVVVLQGYNITVDLVGSTFINKAGVTSSTFKTVPDAPVNSFELTLPQGPYSALAANGNLCKEHLAMPTEFIGQNGAEIHESTPIEVTGCKATIGVLRHAVSGRRATIAVGVPSAGTLTASGAGLSGGSAKASAAGTVTVAVTLSGAEQRFLRWHPGRRLKVDVKLVFTPKHGGKLTSHVTLLMR
jgi:hypothetical protein